MTQRPSAICILLLQLLAAGCATGPEIHFTPSDSDAIEVLMRSEAVPMPATAGAIWSALQKANLGRQAAE